MKLKEDLHSLCVAHVNKRLKTFETTISSNKNALENETKSSAGDKHETGRAMLQLEMEKAGKQLVEINFLNEVLAKINTNKVSNIASLGSIIYTDKMNYFLAISVGKLTVNKDDYFAISVSSPIGKLLIGKQEGDSFQFNKTIVEITKIV